MLQLDKRLLAMASNTQRCKGLSFIS
jgi:hypothetical protein